MPFLIKRIKSRKMLLAGVVFFVLALNILCSYIWFVDVTGLKALPREKIIEVAGLAGLRAGLPKSAVDLHEVEN